MRPVIPIVAAMLTVAACSSIQPAQPQSPTGATGPVRAGGTLTFALNADPDHLDPTLSRSLVSRQIFHAMCEKLYDVDENVRIVPQLAAALPSISPDGRTYTIPLRAGVKFADGTPLDAEAVRRSLDRHLTLETSSRRSELGPITAVRATDPRTVTITLERPTAPLTAALADRAGMVMSPKALQGNFAAGPVCVGPFKFASRVPQSSIELVKDPNYYDAAKVRLDKLVYRIITDGSIRAANLRSGDAQVADTISPEDVPQLSADPNLRVLQSDSLGYQSLTVNVGNADGVGKPPKALATPIAKDPRIRIALEHAIDRDALVRTVFRGLYRTACSPVSPNSPYTSERAQRCRAHDPAKARQLLQEAGAAVPYKIKISVTNTPLNLRLAQTLQAMVKEGGFEMEIQAAEFASLLDLQDAGDYETLQIGWSGRVDADANITPFVRTQAAQNVSGYSDEQVDALLDKAREQLQPAERARTYAQVIELLQRDNPLIYLYRQRNITGVSARLSGVQGFADGLVRVAFAGFVS
ncbi:ABC transporter substrate-binding protein [Nonomuraea sp. NPDC050790]|uniref:ABC transporter substrate-binding protein n=1 Tax=Nonomuraea sp. NPDC050790 TaxID=3364371 RepID=UPI0037A28C67